MISLYFWTVISVYGTTVAKSWVYMGEFDTRSACHSAGKILSEGLKDPATYRCITKSNGENA
jgi:hypothetical protein